MSKIRDKYPYHVPCIVNMPDKTKLKLLLPREASASFLLHAARTKWTTAKVQDHEALLLFYKTRICMGTTRIVTLDDNYPHPVELFITKESTFG